MALTTCVECGKDVSDRADRCPHCGRKKPWQRPMGPRTKAIVLALVGILMYMCYKGPTDTRTPEERKAAAARDSLRAIETRSAEICQESVEGALKAPSTAQWEAPSQAYTKALPKGYVKVQTYVDAQNSFGAMVRTYVECTVGHTGALFMVVRERHWQK